MTAACPPPLPGPDEAHVWQITLNQDVEHLEALARSLSFEERERADRFAFARDRDRFTACRGALRDILGRYLACPPPEIVFAYGPHGKPALANHPSLRFNVSHSNDAALVAVTYRREVGVDIEQIATDRDGDDVARSVFSSAERERLAALPPDKRLRAFFVYWTLKEAYLKATGAGLLGEPQSFTILPGAEGRAGLFARDGSPVSHWFLQEINGGDGYAAALVVAGADVSVRRFVFP